MKNILHGCILSLYKDYEQAVDGVGAFLPYIDNWPVCDLLSPKVFLKICRIFWRENHRVDRLGASLHRPICRGGC